MVQGVLRGLTFSDLMIWLRLQTKKGLQGGKTIQQRSEFFASLVPNASTSYLAHALALSAHMYVCLLVHDFLSQQNNRLFLFLSELMDLFVAGRDQSAADQLNNLAEGHPPL